MNEFKKFPSIPRINKDMVITEKIDWTNACVVIWEDWTINAQSRNRVLTRWQDDNAWFANWVEENKEELMKLWVGYHYGEWYGQGIQRTYWLKEKRFALFCFRGEELPECCETVPVLFEWEFNTQNIEATMHRLSVTWSIAAPGFMNPEWVVIFHKGACQAFKETFDWPKYKLTK